MVPLMGSGYELLNWGERGSNASGMGSASNPSRIDAKSSAEGMAPVKFSDGSQGSIAAAGGEST